MEHISTTSRGGESNIVAIPTHNICVGNGNDIGSGNSADNFENSTVLSSLLSYWGRTTKRMKEEILQHCVVCVISKRGPEGSRERDIHQVNATDLLLHTFGDAKHFFPNKSEGESESTKHTDIQSEYVGNFYKNKLLEARIMYYGMMDPFIIPTLLDDYSGAVEDCWGKF